MMSIIAQAEWGLYWRRTAQDYPEHGAACAWNEYMQALAIMALEANP